MPNHSYLVHLKANSHIYYGFVTTTIHSDPFDHVINISTLIKIIFVFWSISFFSFFLVAKIFFKRTNILKTVTTNRLYFLPFKKEYATKNMVYGKLTWLLFYKSTHYITVTYEQIWMNTTYTLLYTYTLNKYYKNS